MDDMKREIKRMLVGFLKRRDVHSSCFKPKYYMVSQAIYCSHLTGFVRVGNYLMKMSF